MNNNISTYQPPVSKLLTLGNPELGFSGKGYVKLGFKPEHIPELIRMMTDPVLLSDELDEPESMAVIHAWRVLGTLRAEAAIEPLLGLLGTAAQDSSTGLSDWILDDFADIFTQIGPPAVPSLLAFLSGTIHDCWTNSTVTEALAGIAKQHPEYRDQVIQALTHELENSVGKFGENEDVYNGLVIGDLLRLGAVEAATLIKAAFYADRVDSSIVGDWYSVKETLGLAEVDVPGPEPEHLPSFNPFAMRDIDMERFLPPIPHINPIGSEIFQGDRPNRKTKQKRKQEKKSRKQNRRKK